MRPDGPDRPGLSDPSGARARLSVLVSGRVQGVGYRRYVQRHARDLALAGYTENLGDGRVEVVAEGFRPDLDRLLHWIRRGPPHAQVQGVEVQYAESTGLRDFHVY
jgi:acylphosphatase